MNNTTRWMVLAAMLSLVLPALAVDPPGLMNYQGVLRDDNDVPLDGTYDMVFRFFDDADPADPENEIFVDEHLTAGTGAVTVTGGLFDVVLGSGNFYDGTGPGDHPHVYYVFGLHETIYLEVQVGAERLVPRMQVVSAPYAIHAAVLGGYAPSDFINITSEEQEKTGLLRALGGIDLGDGDHDDLTANEVTHLTSGPATYADFLHQHAHADNADTVDGKHASEFIDTSPNSQTKSGMLTIDSNGSHAWMASPSYGIEANGPAAGGYFTTSMGTGYAYVGYLDEGISAHGDVQGGYFEDNQGTSNAHIAYGNLGIESYGLTAGGQFQDLTGGSSAYLGYKEPSSGDAYGVWAEGDFSGGYFRDRSDPSTEAYLARGTTGIYARGSTCGGRFRDTDWTSLVEVGGGGIGVWSEGAHTGGYFTVSGSATARALLGNINDVSGRQTAVIGRAPDVGGSFYRDNGTSAAHLAYLDSSGISDYEYGVWAQGAAAGGYFKAPGPSAEAYLARTGAEDLGVWARGDSAGGYFESSNGSSRAYLGVGDRGIDAQGDYSGGYFYNTSGTAYAEIAYNEPGTGDLYGVAAGGAHAGGIFYDTDGGAEATVGSGNRGIWAYGLDAGGYFKDSNDSGEVYLGHGDQGMWAAGSFTGGSFTDTYPYFTNVWADVAKSVGDPPTVFYKIEGNGTNSFVQNHPQDPDKVVVYSSPEGDEVATYTRGMARLQAGEARISLGTTFQWVTNPDLGLTAHLTPHGDCLGLYVESLTSDELVVRELGGGVSDVSFDYLVMGLRIGFEQAPIVQAKDREAPLPAPGLGAEFYGDLLDPDAHTALQRFRQMEADVRGVTVEEVDLSGAASLREAIKASTWQQIGMAPPASESVADDRRDGGSDTGDALRGDASTESTSSIGRLATVIGGRDLGDEDPTLAADSLTRFPVSGPVEAGDLLALDPERPGVLIRAVTAQDPGVVGIAAEAVVTADQGLRVRLVDTFYAELKVDAGYGEIRPGDLLTSSFTPGHAMRAAEIVPGTIVGKALEPLETGTGSIRVLVMPR
jgi:hypothetical protein